MATCRGKNELLLNDILSKYDWNTLRNYCGVVNKNIDLKDALNLINWILIHNTTCVHNVTPLQGAISLGLANITKALIDEGVLFSATGPPLLSVALERGDYHICKLLINAGVNVNLSYKELLPLGYAFKNPSISPEIVQLVIDAGFCKDGIIDLFNKTTALHQAVISDKPVIVEFLLSISANPDLKDLYGLTPLHYAAQSNNILSIKYLVEHGASIDIKCNILHTPLQYAISNNCDGASELLIELGVPLDYVMNGNRSQIPLLYYAAHNCNLRIVKKLLEKGANVSIVETSSGWSALHAVAANTHHGSYHVIAANCIAEILIQYGADVNCTDVNGCTPLHVAIKNRNLNIANILVFNGSLLNTQCNNHAHDGSYTAFHLAARTGDLNLITLCLEYGADTKTIDSKGLNPIHHLLRSYLASMNPTSKHEEFISILKLFWKQGFPFDKLFINKQYEDASPVEIKFALKKQRILFDGLKRAQLGLIGRALALDAEVNCCSTEVPFPLHLIASKGDELIMLYFLTMEPPVNYYDENGETPLHVAAKFGHIKACRLLLAHGACYNAFTERTRLTPIQLAKENNHVEVTELLNLVNRFHTNFIGKIVTKTPVRKWIRPVINSRCRSGDSLLSRAIQLGQVEEAKRLMTLRMNSIELSGCCHS